MSKPSASAKSIRVLLVDDHPVVRDGLRRLLESTPDIHVAAEADDGEAALACYGKCAPDVVILDISMPGIGGLETIRRLKAHDKDVRILVFTMHESESMIMRTLEAGAIGYLTKRGGMAQMLTAVRQVAQGKPFIDPTHTSGIVYRKLMGSAEDPLSVLSSREFQLFQMFAEGHSVLEIAENLSISPKTVGVHRTNIMKKLGLHNAAQLARLAIQYNIVQS